MVNQQIKAPAVAHEPACWVDGGDLEQLKKLGMGGVLGWPDHGNDPRRVPLFKGTATVQDGAKVALAHIAALAHEGGLAKLNEGGALSHIRRLCLPYWDDKGNHEQQTRRVQSAIDAALDKSQPPIQHKEST